MVNIPIVIAEEGKGGGVEVKKGNRKSIELLTMPNDGGRTMRSPPENPGNMKTTFLFIFLSKFPKYQNYSIF
jgi:hypothetical protein